MGYEDDSTRYTDRGRTRTTTVQTHEWEGRGSRRRVMRSGLVVLVLVLLAGVFGTAARYGAPTFVKEAFRSRTTPGPVARATPEPQQDVVPASTGTATSGATQPTSALGASATGSAAATTPATGDTAAGSPTALASEGVATQVRAWTFLQAYTQAMRDPALTEADLDSWFAFPIHWYGKRDAGSAYMYAELRPAATATGAGTIYHPAQPVDFEAGAAVDHLVVKVPFTRASGEDGLTYVDYSLVTAATGQPFRITAVSEHVQ